jgi:hypothetical protein
VREFILSMLAVVRVFCLSRHGLGNPCASTAGCRAQTQAAAPTIELLGPTVLDNAGRKVLEHLSRRDPLAVRFLQHPHISNNYFADVGDGGPATSTAIPDQEEEVASVPAAEPADVAALLVHATAICRKKTRRGRRPA